MAVGSDDGADGGAVGGVARVVTPPCPESTEELLVLLGLLLSGSVISENI